jgi:carbon-monoxide dehydrogenase large subunit
MKADALYVGKEIPRIDGLDKATGRAVYSVDVDLPGMLYGSVVRSPFPHAKILRIETSGALRIPGVRAVVTGKDFPFLFGALIQDQPFLAIDKVRYVGEPVVAVAAETELIAQEATDRIRVEYEGLAPVFDPQQASAEGAPLIHEHLEDYFHSDCHILPKTNICSLHAYSSGDMDLGWKESEEIFEDEFFIHAVAHSPMEPHAAVAQYGPSSEEFTLWSATDRPYRLAQDLVKALDISFDKVRFISTFSGGSFGGKGALVAEGLAVALARFTKGRPVKVVYSREEELTASQTRHGALVRLRTGVKKDGTLVARKANVLWDNGAYCGFGPNVARRGSRTVFGPYRIPHVELISHLVYTNKQPGGAYRGFGTTQMTWACEAQMDIMAEKLGLDPLEIRMRNAYVEGDLYINGQVLRSVGLKETLERASRAIGWGKSESRKSGTNVRGKGLATTIKGTSTPTDSACLIEVAPDGAITILSSSVEIGGGQKTVLAQIAAETIGVPLSSISVPNPDTRLTPFDFGVSSSRTTYHMGNAVRRAGEKIRERILEIAGEILATDPACLKLSEGKILKEGAGEQLSLKALLAKKFGSKGGTLLEAGYYTPEKSSLLEAPPDRKGMSSIFWMFATHAAEVEVDTETGRVNVLRIAAAHDVGRAINPVGCEQQIEGAVILGLSNTLFEEFKLEDGRVLNNTLADYKIASTLDIPKIIPILVESRHPEGPFNAKGIGEPAAAPTAPAIASAIFDAVGVRIKELPITPEKVLVALREKGQR